MREPVAAVGSGVFAKGTPVYIDSSGFLAPIATDERPYGFCTEDVTAIATNSSGSTVGVTQQNDPTAVGYAPRVIDCENVEFWMDCDEDLTQTSIGQYMDVTISAGVVTGNLVSGSTGLFLVTGLLSNENQEATGDANRVICRVAERLDVLGA
ncbi:MAG: hypothetical protein WC763_05175 [Candidatus Paceibacterota bacterium]